MSNIIKRPLVYDIVLFVIVVAVLFDFDYSKGNLDVQFIDNVYVALALLIFVSFYGLFLVRKIKVVGSKVTFYYWFYKFVFEKEKIKEIKIKHDMRFPYVQVFVKNRGKRKFYYWGFNTNILSNGLEKLS